MDAFYEDNKYFPLTKGTLNQPIFLEPQTKPNFSSSNRKSLCIVTSNTITDKCILVRDLCKLFQLFQGFSSQPWQTLYSYNVGIWFPMIGNKVYQFDFSKISDKARLFKFGLEAFLYSIRMDLSLAKRLMSFRKSCCHQQSSLFWFLGLLSIHL